MSGWAGGGKCDGGVVGGVGAAAVLSIFYVLIYNIGQGNSLSKSHDLLGWAKQSAMYKRK